MHAPMWALQIHIRADAVVSQPHSSKIQADVCRMVMGDTPLKKPPSPAACTSLNGAKAAKPAAACEGDLSGRVATPESSVPVCSAGAARSCCASSACCCCCSSACRSVTPAAFRPPAQCRWKLGMWGSEARQRFVGAWLGAGACWLPLVL